MVEERVQRRLAAILAADVASYSRLMGSDEEGTQAALKACHREPFEPKIAEHRGRTVKTTGDGALVEFASAGDAVRCAMEIQRTMERHVLAQLHMVEAYAGEAEASPSSLKPASRTKIAKNFRNLTITCYPG